MLACVTTALTRGLEGRLVEVQVDHAPGYPGLHLVGLAAASVRESRERVKSAIRNSGLTFPGRHLTVNLAPAELPKEGAGLDLAIAVAISLAELQRPSPQRCAFIGELALDGAVRHVDGVLVAARALREAGCERLFVAFEDACEAALVPGLKVHACPNLGAAIAHLTGEHPLPAQLGGVTGPPELAGEAVDDLAEVHGQEAARRALEVAAAGGHHLLMSGPPGSGKTMLARCLPGILPPMDLEEALEVAQLRSILGELEVGRPLTWTRPFRAPHHGISAAGLIGGGNRLARPGEISRAHRGVLFLDELAEFSATTLQSLRQPIERGRVTISRSGGSVDYPCCFTLVAATNPCPCGWWGDSITACRCSRNAIEAYQRALSGPLLDRIDLQVGVTRPPLEALASEPAGEATAAVRARVVAARVRQLERQGGLNSTLTAAGLRRLAALAPAARRSLERWATERGLTARGFHRAWRVARTLADLAGEKALAEEHVLEALGYRLNSLAA